MFLASIHPHLRPIFALLGLLLLDIAHLERLQKDWMKRGAKFLEEFDTQVLQLPWNSFIAAAPADPEDKRSASAMLLTPKKREAEITCWYEPVVAGAPIALGCLICQRTNISYDSRLRRRYGSWLLGFGLGLTAVLVVYGMIFQLHLGGLLLSVIVPFIPALNWALREHRKQADTAIALLTLKNETQKLWDYLCAQVDRRVLPRFQ
ncbi:hypothetical protein IQ22_04176 [Pseudomonas duriflava]|uniref:Uncharacterized protein n=2 Tax=Pseudomonas duriflava TaxID=459528 RepID=A0A562PUY5_9PSED|nr:hypothetical protein IQ22_04176 [Pseudomonas duriflava]